MFDGKGDGKSDGGTVGVVVSVIVTVIVGIISVSLGDVVSVASGLLKGLFVAMGERVFFGF